MITVLLASHQAFETNQIKWLVGVFSSISGLIIPFSVVGIFAIRWKHKIVFFVYICGMIASLALLIVGSVGCFSLIVKLLISSKSIHTDIAACQLGLYACCCCGNHTSSNHCPEWSPEEVLVVIRTDLKFSGITALLCTFYILVALLSGYPLWKNIRNHRIMHV